MFFKQLHINTDFILDPYQLYQVMVRNLYLQFINV